MKKLEFYHCKHCGNIVYKVTDKGVPVICCGEPMGAMAPNTTDAAQEKHVPVVENNNGVIKATVGSVTHPMMDEHFIQWIALETEKGVQIKHLTPSDAPVVEFAVVSDKAVAVYEYCNLHGLWKVEL